MSIPQPSTEIKSSSAFDPQARASHDKDEAKKDRPLDVSAINYKIDQHVNACMGEFLTMLQSFQMEFDVENPIGRLPRCFAREFGDTISEYIFLRDPNQNEFEVHVIRRSNELYFDNGWHSLGDVYDISFGAWVTVTYVSPTLLNMRVTTRWGAEIVYPCHNPPLRHILPRSGSNFDVGSSLLNMCSPGSSQPGPFLRTYVKELTAYDVYSGILSLPWYGFGKSAFAFVFSDLILVDSTGKQYKCSLSFGVDALGDFCCNVSDSWLELCSSHGVVEGDRVKFSVAHYSASNVMYVSIYPRIALDAYLKTPLD